MKKEKEIPFIAIGNDELGEDIGKEEKVKCKNCGKYHTIKYGKRKLKDGTYVESKMLGFVDCGKKSFLVTIDNKLIN